MFVSKEVSYNSVTAYDRIIQSDMIGDNKSNYFKDKNFMLSNPNIIQMVTTCG